MTINVLHCSYSNSVGGAAKAAYRLHKAFQLHSNDKIRSAFYSTESDFGIRRATYSKLTRYVSRQIASLQKDDNYHMKSLALLPSFRSSYLNKTEADVLHLHWIQSEFISIEDISRLRKSLVWTLHDSWAFCGAEHHPRQLDYTRPTMGYLPTNRPTQLRGIDLDRFCWQRKLSSWDKEIVFVCVSQWLARKAQASIIGKKHRVVSIPNAVDIRFFEPLEKKDARRQLGIHEAAKFVLISASSLLTDYNKGLHLLVEALNKLNAAGQTVGLILAGDDSRLSLDSLYKTRFPIKRMGYISEIQMIRSVYCSADCTVVPSYVESLPQSATESLSLGTPVIGFTGSGLEDCIVHGNNGLLIRDRSAEYLATAISEFLVMQAKGTFDKSDIASRARSLWHPEHIASRYASLYQDVLLNHG